MSPRIGITSDTILASAARLADERGINEVTLALLAKELGIRPPSLYNHIGGLDDLKAKLAAYGLKILYERMVSAAVGKSGDDAVRSLSMAYLAFAGSRPGLYHAIFQTPQSADPAVQRMYKKILDIVVKVLEGYELDQASTLHIVRGLRTLLHGFASLEQIGGYQMEFDKDESLSFLIDLFLKGIHSLKQ